MENYDLEPQLMELVVTMETIFHKNISWLKENNKKLFKAVNKAVKKKSQSTFAVELNVNEGTLDIINKDKNTFIYHQDPFKYGDKKASKIKKSDNLKKFIFKETLLGTHITSIIKTYKPKKATICENDIYKFLCSLYITDYEELSQISQLEFYIDTKCKEGKNSTIVTVDDLG